jgi:hypothetical protein
MLTLAEPSTADARQADSVQPSPAPAHRAGGREAAGLPAETVRDIFLNNSGQFPDAARAPTSGIQISASDFAAIQELVRGSSALLQPMKRALILGRALYLSVALPLAACQHQPQYSLPYLPSRPPAEMFPRASSPPPVCPGQYRSTIEDSGGAIFLGCWGSKTT